MTGSRALLTAMPAALVGVALLLATGVRLHAQEQFQFVVSAVDGEGKPVTDLKPEDVVMSENGVADEIVKTEPFHVPVELTLAIDNGPQSRDALSSYRAGLEGLVKALPDEVEITVITTSPQPRRVVPATTDRAKILRGLNGFAPQDQSPRFTDALVEFSKRYQDEFKKAKRFDSLPVIVMVSTTTNEATSYQLKEINDALNFLQSRKAKVYVTMNSAKNDVGSTADLNSARQAIIAIPITKATGGRYESMAISSRLATLLPEYGQEIAKLHDTHYNQVLVTVRRSKGLSGPLQNPRIELNRAGLNGQVSLDGLF